MIINKFLNTIKPKYNDHPWNLKILLLFWQVVFVKR